MPHKKCEKRQTAEDGAEEAPRSRVSETRKPASERPGYMALRLPLRLETGLGSAPLRAIPVAAFGFDFASPAVRNTWAIREA